MGSSFISRLRCKPGDHFTHACKLHLPDFFEKVEQEEMSNQQSSLHSLFREVPDFTSRILYEDDHVIALNKPSGICCQVLLLSISIMCSLQSILPLPFSNFFKLFVPKPYSILSIVLIVYLKIIDSKFIF